MTSEMTADRLEAMRRKEARDRRVFKRMAVIVPAIVAAAVLFELADIVDVPAQQIPATVQSLDDTWTLKHGHRCITRLATPLGPATLHTTGACAQVRWHVGQSDQVQARRFRLSHYIAIFPEGSLFRRGSGSPF